MNPGEKIRRWREALGLSQPEAAAKLGLSRSHLGNIETGTYVPSLSLAGKLEQMTEGAVTMQDWAYCYGLDGRR